MHRTALRLVMLAVSLALVSPALAQPYNPKDFTTIYNRSGYDLWVAQGGIKDASIAGLGDNGFTDPDQRAFSSGWQKLAKGGSLEIKGGFLYIAAINGGKHMRIMPDDDSRWGTSDPKFRRMETLGITLEGKKFEGYSVNVPRGGNRVGAIQAQGKEIAAFIALDMYYNPTAKLRVVGASKKVQDSIANFMKSSSSFGGTYIQVTNNTKTAKQMQVHLLSSANGPRMFADFKTVGAGKSETWLVSPGDGNVVRAANGNIMVGVKGADPFDTAFKGRWGIDDANTVSGLPNYNRTETNENGKNYVRISFGVN